MKIFATVGNTVHSLGELETPSNTCLLKWHVSCVFDNSANLIMMLPRDSRYNLALSLLKSDNCRQSYTASGPHVPMCPP